jgi:hypothetical protein
LEVGGCIFKAFASNLVAELFIVHVNENLLVLCVVNTP